MADVELFSWQFCPFAQRTLIALAEKNVNYRLHEVDITKPYPDVLYTHNPDGKVPTLVYDGRAVYESDVLAEFIDEAFEGRPLLPVDPYDRAMARLIINLTSAGCIPAMYRLLLNQNKSADQSLADAALEQWNRIGKFLTSHAPGSRYYLAEPSLADFAVGPFFQRWAVIAYYRNVDFPDTADYARVREWRDACLGLDAIANTAADRKTLIKVYADYARGYDNGKIPEGAEISSFDVEAWPPDQRPLPPPGLRADQFTTAPSSMVQTQ